MKNVIKKALSLLLVGVVTVSMFSFIRPNRVDAKVNLSHYFVCVQTCLGADGYYKISFFDKKGNPISGSIRAIKDYAYAYKGENFYVPYKAATMEFEALSPVDTGRAAIRANFTASFILSESIRDNVLVITININSIEIQNDTHGCQIYNYSYSRAEEA